MNFFKLIFMVFIALVPLKAMCWIDCDTGIRGSGCSNIFECNDGYLSDCSSSCTPVGDCMKIICTSCSCIPGYKPADSIRVTNRSIVVAAYCTCKKIVNTTGKDIFVPLKTSGEWSNFYNNPPSGVGVTDDNTCDDPITS